LLGVELMILDLERISSDVERIAGDEVVAFSDVSGAENRIDTHIELNIRRVGETYYIHADLTGVFSTTCHRCLEPATCRVAPSFDLVVQRTEERGEPTVPSGDEEFIRLPRGEYELSLEQHIYESLIVNIPIQITCSEGCNGLCPNCGTNLNRGECRCTPEGDTRWDALRKLKGQLPR
jgi:uncharacterized protein